LAAISLGFSASLAMALGIMTKLLGLRMENLAIFKGWMSFQAMRIRVFFPFSFYLGVLPDKRLKK
jgi:hypothetical protein